ncbi:urease accessory protein UreE [Plastorhodobacter daqingensis]|uniref:Urease accessory protein UreE n=1 Tax=Plastorhodobacter daqingensis TaxID=1387281 RepID=A0ABW2UJD4_9RHOB
MTAPFPPAQAVCRAGSWSDACDRVVLDYDGRFLRRKRLTTAGGASLVVDLPEVTSLDHGDALQLLDGRLIEIVAADEPLLQVTGPHLPRLAWHVGNRHTPCQIEADRLLIRQDHVLAGMLRGLGAELVEITAPFRPEGGAYGHGRTMGHDHGPGEHDHGHGHGHGRHSHVHHHAAHLHTADDPDTAEEAD